MGLIVTDTITLNNGIEITNYYVNIGEIKITKESGTSYGLDVKYNFYTSKNARLDNRKTFEQGHTTISVDTLDNMYTQIYTEVKTNFTSYTDDL